MNKSGKRTPNANPVNENTYSIPLGPWNTGHEYKHANSRVVNGPVWDVQDDERYITLFHIPSVLSTTKDRLLYTGKENTKFKNMKLVDTGRTLTSIPGVKMFRVVNEDENADIETYQYFCDWVGGGRNGHKIQITYETYLKINQLEIQDQLDLMRSSSTRGGGKTHIRNRRKNKTIKKKNSKKSKTMRKKN